MYVCMYVCMYEYVYIYIFKRVKNICNNIKSLTEGEELMRTTLRNSDYPENIIHKAHVIANREPKIHISNEAMTSNSII